MVVQASAKTDVGCVRERNEDAFLIDEGHALFVVADGMGGHAGGARASGLAISTLTDYIRDGAEQVEAMPPPQGEDNSPPVAQFLADGVRAACAAIFDTAVEDPSLSGMGTTTTALLLRHGWAYIAHVGDSRCYMVRAGRIFQLTDDHSLVNEQVRAGLMTKEMAAKSRMKNIITRSVGFERDVDVDTFLLPVEVGDHFLLCSDGLSNLVEENELGDAMRASRGEPLVQQLVTQALERGGDDNITVVSVVVGADEAAHSHETHPNAQLSDFASNRTTDGAAAATPDAGDVPADAAKGADSTNTDKTDQED